MEMRSSKAPRQRACHSCQRALSADQKICQCGAPTEHMSFAERAQWEVQQYRAYQARTTAGAERAS